MRADWKRLLAPGIVVALVAGLYLPSLGNPLVWDDVPQVERARNDTLVGLFTRTSGEDNLRPVTLLSYRLQIALGGDDPGAYHAVNILVHAFNAALLLLLLVRLGLSLEAATAASILFAVHPLQSAAVAYVSGRADLLAVAFSLLAVQCVLISRDTDARAPWAWGLAALAAALAAPLSKEVGLTAPLLAAAACRVILPGDGGRPAPVAVPLMMAGAGLLSIWFVFPPAIARGAELPLFLRLRGMGTSLLTYASLLVVPLNLHLDRLSAVGGAGTGALGALVLGSFAPAILLFFRRPTVPAFAAVALVLTYGPASGLVPVYPEIAEQWIFTPEHFMYAPLVILAPLAIAGVSAAILYGTGSPSMARVSGRALLVIAALLTAAAVLPVRARQFDLSSEERLYRSVLAHSPSPRACFNLGVAALERGDYASAVDIYEACAERHPDDAGMHSQLGVAYQFVGNFVGARAAYERALLMNPNDPVSISNLASLDASVGRYAEARAGWKLALELRPGFTDAIDGLEELLVLEAQEP